MREVKFRGLRTDGEGWTVGDLVHKAGNAFSHRIEVGIRLPNCYPDEVIPESVGQFTGLKDKNGKEIYEGDIIKVPRGDWGVIVYKAPFFEVTVSETQSSSYSREFLSEIEIIGNIHENPELLNK